MKTFALVALFFCSFSSFGQTLNEYMEFIEHWEGRRAEAYTDSEGHLTIGVGHKLTSKIGPLSDAEIDSLLRADTLKAITAAKKVVVSFDKQPEIIRLILVDMAFNLGKKGLSRFEKTISACNMQDYRVMSLEMMDSKWYRQTGRRAKHHVKKVRETENE